MGVMKFVGKVSFMIGMPWLWMHEEGRSESERIMVRRKNSERMGTAAVIAAMRSSVAPFVASAGYDCIFGAHVVVAVPAEWSDERVKDVGNELTRLVYAECGADVEAERASRLAGEESDRLWGMRWIETVDPNVPIDAARLW